MMFGTGGTANEQGQIACDSPGAGEQAVRPVEGVRLCRCRGVFRYDLRVEPGMSIRPYNAPVIWQRNYYEHVIRSDGEFHRIRKYIAGNPAKWDLDRENPG